MGDSMDTKDLDSYGVWVKMPPQDSINEEKSLDELLNTGAFDSIGSFPDFSESNKTSDNDSEESAANDIQEDSGDDLFQADINDATLTEEELSNISDSVNGVGESADGETESGGDDDNLIADDFFPDMDDTSAVPESGETASSEDVSLDDFMDEDFTEPTSSAQSVPSSDGGEDGEVSLDDFLDDVSFGSETEETKKEDDIPDEAPLDIDLKFNETVSEQVTVEDEPQSAETPVTEQSASPSKDTADGDGFTANSMSTASEVPAEEVDLSDFGIDGSAAETPVTANVQEAKKNESVDYELSVSDNVQTAAPATETNPVPASEASGAEDFSVNGKLLQQIVEDLSGLKNEINLLKTEFNELKSRDFTERTSGEPFEPEVKTEDTGFFSSGDDDDTIALSGDELNNIMQSADFTDDDTEQESPETNADDILENREQEETIADYFGDKTGIEDEFETNEAAPAGSNSGAEIQESFEEPQIIEETAFSDDDPFGAIGEDEIIIPDEEHDSGLTLDVENEVLEEPDLNGLNALNMPEEISIPKASDPEEPLNGDKNLDDILVESAATDFMESVTDSPQEPPQLAEETAAAESQELPNESVEVPQDDEIFDEMLAEEPPISEVLSKESVDYLAEEGRVEDSAEENDTQEENDDALGAELPSDLKADVKSVLLYMDQLLENLPEEKIMEFAKSEQFITYKKLFTELGLA
ncbi:MAG: hypothetical protein ACTTKL_09105 [Treponema sp.]